MLLFVFLIGLCKMMLFWVFSLMFLFLLVFGCVNLFMVKCSLLCGCLIEILVILVDVVFENGL